MVTARIALTPGEPAGIGPDLAVMLAQQARRSEIIAIADPDLLLQRATELDLPLTLREVRLDDSPVADAAGTLAIRPQTLRAPCNSGELNPTNAAYVLATLDAAIDGCLRGDFDAMVTAPLHKGVINDAGVPFTGHTEHLAQRCDSEVVMMLVADELRVALVTTHLPLSQVASSLSAELIERVVRTLHADLIGHFGLSDPHILVCGLNPHAGEGGHMGREEIDIIIPTLDRCRADGIRLSGPLPADTLFTPHHLTGADAVLAMYHDQGLPVLKYAGFGRGINVTLGLPIIRTSVDHGTALDKAGTGNIDVGSLNAAVTLADSMAMARR